MVESPEKVPEIAPGKPEGPVDWEALFEHPETGLIPVISRARSPAALRKSAIAVFRQLYSREKDPSEVEKFVDGLSALIPDDTAPGDMARLVDAVTDILRQTKEDRVHKAAASHEAKAAIGAHPAAPLPGARGWARRLARRQAARAAKNKPSRLAVIAWWLVGAGVFVAGYFAVAHFEQPVALLNTPILIDQMKSAALGVPLEIHAFGGGLRAGTRDGKIFVTAEGVPQEACFNVAWALLNHGVVVINERFSHQMGRPVIKNLCGLKGDTAALTWFPK